MSALDDPDTERLLAQAAAGDDGAREQLLQRHRARLRQMVAVRLDPRLAGRVDPSDVVQEALMDAHRRLGDYLGSRPVAFYPWLRALAYDRLVELYREHVRAQKRSVRREERLPLPDASALELASRLAARGSGPGAGLAREEVRQLVHRALARLPDRDREVLVLRHLEQLSVGEVAAILGTTEGAVSVRLLRALRKLREFLGEGLLGDVP
ncbi:MAG: sigma-70 family RNA polymerase sigma factor [Gemmataceae bacterium]